MGRKILLNKNEKFILGFLVASIVLFFLSEMLPEVPVHASPLEDECNLYRCSEDYCILYERECVEANGRGVFVDYIDSSRVVLRSGDEFSSLLGVGDSHRFESIGVRVYIKEIHYREFPSDDSTWVGFEYS